MGRGYCSIWAGHHRDFAGISEETAKCFDEELDVGTPAGVGQLDAIAISQFLEILRKLIGGGHPGAAHEDGDDGNVALQSGSSLDAHEIGRIVETSRTVFIFGVDPFQTDDDEQHATLGDAFFDSFAEVAAGLDGGDIHENGVFAEVLRQIVKQTASLTLRITAPITDKNAGQIASLEELEFSAVEGGRVFDRGVWRAELARRRSGGARDHAAGLPWGSCCWTVAHLACSWETSASTRSASRERGLSTLA